MTTDDDCDDVYSSPVVNGSSNRVDDVCVSTSSSKSTSATMARLSQSADEVSLRRLVLVKRSSADVILDSTLDYRLKNVVVIQDDGLTDFTLARVLMRVCYSSLTSIHLVDCPLLQLGDETAETMTSLPLRSLVLSRTSQRRLPVGVFRLRGLELLKVDRNWLAAIPHEIGQLTRLRVFSCDGQRPRGLRCLPAAAMRCLERLEVLSLAANRVETLEPWVGALRQLRVIRAGCNRLRRLPASLNDLPRLSVVDVRRNRRLRLDSALTPLITRLQGFDVDATAAGRPGRCVESRCSVDQLVQELDLPRQRRLAVERASELVRDISVAVVGPTCAGKTTLLEALCSQRGVCTSSSRGVPHHVQPPDLTSSSNKHAGWWQQRPVPVPGGLEVRCFETKCPDDDVTTTCSVSAFLVSSDHAFNYVRQFHVDLYLLVVDLTSFESSPRGGASSGLFQQQQQQRPQSSSRCVARLRQWLQALADVAPDVPVLLVGTRAAELAKSSATTLCSPADVWRSDV